MSSTPQKRPNPNSNTRMSIGTPVGTPVRTPSKIGTPIRTNNILYLRNKTPGLVHALTILNNNKNNITFRNFNSNQLKVDNRETSYTNKARKRTTNPNNIVYMDKENKKIYKISLWKDHLENEYKAYKKLAANYKNHQHIHTARMYDCRIIPGTKYGLLVLELVEGLNKNSLIQSYNNKSLNEAINFLERYGIKHNDELGNIYKINRTFNGKSEETFFIIDFEQSTFTNNKGLNANNIKYLRNVSTKIKEIENNEINKYQPKKGRRSIINNNRVAPSPMTNWLRNFSFSLQQD